MHPLTVILRIAGFFVGLWLVSTGLSLMTNGTGCAILFDQDFFGGIASLVLGWVSLPSERERADRGSPTLLVPREEAEKKITTQIEKGQEIRNAQISSWEALQSAETERSKWQKYTGELLRRLFDSPSLAEEFNP